jgi:hypothetical protein
MSEGNSGTQSTTALRTSLLITRFAGNMLGGVTDTVGKGVSGVTNTGMC